MAAFELYLRQQGLAARTVRQILGRLDTILENCSPLSESTFSAFEVELLSKYSPAAANKYIQALNHWLDFNELPRYKSVKRLKETRRPRILLTDSEIEQFLTAKDNPMMNCLWALIAFSGARPTEILQLRVEHLDLIQGVIILEESKTNEGRIIPIAPVIRQQVSDYLSGLESDRLFSCTYDWLLKDFKERLSILGIKKKATPYSLRHSFITRMLSEAESPLFVVQDIVGHKKADTTRGYYHSNAKVMHRAMKKDPLVKQSLSAEERLQLAIEYIEQYGLETDNSFKVEIQKRPDTYKLIVKIK